MHSGLDRQNHRVGIEESSQSEPYFCPLCHHQLVRKTGMIRRHHFAHKQGSACDSWFEEDGKFQDLWKSCFPLSDIEAVITSGEEKHFADVLCGDTVMNFRESFLFPKTSFADRNAFYLQDKKKVIWVFDAYGASIEFAYRDVNFLKRAPLTFESTIRKDSLSLDLFYLHAGKKFSDLFSIGASTEIYLHVNDNLMLKVEEKKSQQNDEIGFHATVMKVSSFLNGLGLEVPTPSPFLDFYLDRKRECDHSLLQEQVKQLPEEERRTGEALLRDKDEDSFSSLLSLLHLSSLPSDELPYFIPNPAQKVIGDFLFVMLEKNAKEREAFQKKLQNFQRTKPSPILTPSLNQEMPMMKPDTSPKLSWHEVALEVDFTLDNTSDDITISRDVFRHRMTFRTQTRRFTLEQARKATKNPDEIVEMAHEEKKYQKIIDEKEKFLRLPWTENQGSGGSSCFENSLYGHDLRVYQSDHRFYPCYPDQDTIFMQPKERTEISFPSLIQAAKFLFDAVFSVDNGDDHLVLTTMKILGFPNE